MVAYAQLESRVWKLTSKTTDKVSFEKMSSLYFRVQQWYRGLEPDYRLNPTEANMLAGRTRSENGIRVLFYLKVNQLQLFIFRQELLHCRGINEDLPNASFAVEAAKDNIRLLRRVSHTTDLYSAHQAPFNHYLVSALAVLFLAVCHAPYQFSNVCQEEFIVALELIQGFSLESHLGRRLWKRVQHLREISLSLGMLPKRAHTGGTESNILNSTDATLPITGDPSTGPDQHAKIQQRPVWYQGRTPQTDETIDPHQLTGDLNTIFDTMQQPYRWSAAGEVGPDGNQQSMNWELSREFLDLV
jgi:hypothetical protein